VIQLFECILPCNLREYLQNQKSSKKILKNCVLLRCSTGSIFIGFRLRFLGFVNNYSIELFWYHFVRPYLCRPLLKKELVLKIKPPQIQQIIF